MLFPHSIYIFILPWTQHIHTNIFMLFKISVQWVGIWVLHTGLPPAFFWACHHTIVSLGLVQFCTGEVRKLSHHTISSVGSLGVEQEYSASKEMMIQHQRAWTWWSGHPFPYPSVLVTMFQFCEQSWLSSSPLSTGIHRLTSIPPPSAHDPAGHSVNEYVHTCYTSLEIFTPSSVEILADVQNKL